MRFFQVRRPRARLPERRPDKKSSSRIYAFETLEQRIVLYNLTGREWTDPNVSYSFLPDGTSTEGYSSSLYQMLDGAATTEAWQHEFAEALQTWANVSNLNFYWVPDDGSPTGTSGSSQGDSRFGDIRLGAHPLDGYLAYAYYPGGSTRGGDVTLNPQYGFHIDATYDMYSVFLHELGHSLGLDHSDVSESVMYPVYRFYSGLLQDDIDAIQAIYGARQEDSFDAAGSNDGFGSATVLSLDSSGSAAFGADLTSFADVDFYRIALPSNADGSLTVSVDARGVSLLAPSVSVYDANGVLIGSATADYGQLATVTLTGLSADQTYYLVADGATGDAFGMGAYRFDVNVGLSDGGSPPAPAPDPDPAPTPQPDRFEVNDTFTLATGLGTLNNASETGLNLHDSSDVDDFSFSVRRPGTFQISIGFANAQGNLDLVVYDTQHNVIARGDSQTDNEALTLSLSSNQEYFVEVLSPDGAINSYDLLIEKVGGGGGKGGGKGGNGKGKKLEVGDQADGLLAAETSANSESQAPAALAAAPLGVLARESASPQALGLNVVSEADRQTVDHVFAQQEKDDVFDATKGGALVGDRVDAAIEQGVTRRRRTGSSGTSDDGPVDEAIEDIARYLWLV